MKGLRARTMYAVALMRRFLGAARKYEFIYCRPSSHPSEAESESVTDYFERSTARLPLFTPPRCAPAARGFKGLNLTTRNFIAATIKKSPPSPTQSDVNFDCRQHYAIFFRLVCHCYLLYRLVFWLECTIVVYTIFLMKTRLVNKI